ncbi:MAG: hypothetical protein AAF577_17515 [Pseudomonadota bacterium]
MTAHTASLVNAVTLLACAAWGFVAIGAESFTPLIPAAFGIGLIACYQGVKAENKMVAHIAVTLTLIVFIALFMPLQGAIGRGDMAATVRVGLMQITTLVALVFFVKSFIDARKKRA